MGYVRSLRGMSLSHLVLSENTMADGKTGKSVNCKAHSQTAKSRVYGNINKLIDKSIDTYIALPGEASEQNLTAR